MVEREVANLWCTISGRIFGRSTTGSGALSKSASLAFNRARTIGIKWATGCKLAGSGNTILIDGASTIRLPF